ncbi:unnamed protein product [Lampetra fluviatilis]
MLRRARANPPDPKRISAYHKAVSSNCEQTTLSRSTATCSDEGWRREGHWGSRIHAHLVWRPSSREAPRADVGGGPYPTGTRATAASRTRRARAVHAQHEGARARAARAPLRSRLFLPAAAMQPAEYKAPRGSIISSTRS